MRRYLTPLALGAALVAAPALAQLGLPRLTLPVVNTPTLPLNGTITGARETVDEAVQRLMSVRIERIDRLLERFPELVELDARGELARRGELLVVGSDAESLRAAKEAGFVLSGTERLDSLGLAVSRLSLPPGLSLAQGEALLRKAAPRAEIVADTLYFQSGTPPLPVLSAATSARAGSINTPTGVIDGAAAQRVSAVRGFAKGAPVASHHGSAVASLLAGAGVRDIRVADIYGTDPAGGNALALVRALDWLIGGGAQVVSISLAGPNNVAVSKAIAAAQRKGAVIVAAVGNDGPAAPPAYPASYPDVVAVTAVDGRNRPLIEAGRASHLDYAAPGADIVALNKAGKKMRVRGTSYAAPLVAARAARALELGTAWRTTLDREAKDLGPTGADGLFGRGLLCGSCGR
jgi:hypothetical protein